MTPPQGILPSDGLPGYSSIHRPQDPSMWHGHGCLIPNSPHVCLCEVTLVGPKYIWDGSLTKTHFRQDSNAFLSQFNFRFVVAGATNQWRWSISNFGCLILIIKQFCFRLRRELTYMHVCVYLPDLHFLPYYYKVFQFDPQCWSSSCLVVLQFYPDKH